MAIITAEIARELAARSWEVRRKRAADAKQAEDSGLAMQHPQPQSADYTADKLSRTRKQLSMLDGMLEASTDAKEIKALADAIARLSEIERILAGRPLPGSRRPGRERASAPASVEPISTSMVEPIVPKPTVTPPASSDDYAI